jgi:hypothetical protein
VLTYKFDNTNPEALKLFLTGELREDSLLPELPENGNRIIVNLDLVTGLNSVGTRLWCRWIGDAQNKFREIFIEEAPMLFVKAFGQIQGAITKNTKVVSLKVPYYSDALGENKVVTVRMDEHYSYDGPFKMPEVKDSLGQLMEIDVIEESYFSFLRL